MAKLLVTRCYRDDKVTFPNQQAARKLILLLKAAGANEAELLRPYRCSTHHGYHIGRVA